ncbi:hypothetical protein AAW31_07145 [Nitrosomonas communis]|uniref:Uncharacterized protein n=1 Tax=Nitrosomonas communis TaxID=44574 RepID=A0A0F7KB79_9PROT|nr:hypothetical protein AAW31_07145 [Nitrosomonas communis]
MIGCTGSSTKAQPDPFFIIYMRRMPSLNRNDDVLSSMVLCAHQLGACDQCLCKCSISTLSIVRIAVALRNHHHPEESCDHQILDYLGLSSRAPPRTPAQVLDSFKPI